MRIKIWLALDTTQATQYSPLMNIKHIVFFHKFCPSDSDYMACTGSKKKSKINNTQAQIIF